MTREEAKEVFINRGYINVKGGTIFDGDKWRQSVAVITEWLKEQPCEDAISRQQCIDAVNKILAQYVPKIYLYTLPLELEKAITDLPSVSVVEKVGEWIPPFEPCDDVISKRANCIHRHENGNCLVIGGFCTSVTDKHCPICGAKMAESEE